MAECREQEINIRDIEVGDVITCKEFEECYYTRYDKCLFRPCGNLKFGRASFGRTVTFFALSGFCDPNNGDELYRQVTVDLVSVDPQRGQSEYVVEYVFSDSGYCPDENGSYIFARVRRMRSDSDHDLQGEEVIIIEQGARHKDFVVRRLRQLQDSVSSEQGQ